MNPLAPILQSPPRGEDGKPQGPPPITFTLALGLVGVLLGAFVSNLDTRLTAFSLADLRGGIGYGEDEASWVTVAYNVAEIAVVPVTPWLAGMVSQRRLVAAATVLLTLGGVLCPWAASQGFTWLVGLRFVQGLGGGALIPLLLGVFLRFLPLHQRAYGFALYALVTASTPLLSEWVAGVLTDIVGWQSVFYLGAAVGPVVLFLALVGLPVEAVKWDGFRSGDYVGIVLAAIWTSLLTVACTVGQRLDWFSSPLIVSLFAAAGPTFLAFLLWEATHTAPVVNLKLLRSLNFSGGLCMIFVFSVSTLMTSSVLPSFGSQVRGFRQLQVGDVLIWAALGQLIVCAAAPLLARVLEIRLVMALGLVVATVGARMATYIDSDWVLADILPSHVLQACGQPLIMVGLIVVATSTLQMTDAVAGSTMFNMARTLAGSVGGAVIGGIEVVRERVHSNTIVDHVIAGATPIPGIIDRVRRQAETMAAADAYGWIGMASLAGLILTLILSDTKLFKAPDVDPSVSP